MLSRSSGSRGEGALFGGPLPMPGTSRAMRHGPLHFFNTPVDLDIQVPTSCIFLIDGHRRLPDCNHNRRGLHKLNLQSTQNHGHCIQNKGYMGHSLAYFGPNPDPSCSSAEAPQTSKEVQAGGSQLLDPALQGPPSTTKLPFNL